MPPIFIKDQHGKRLTIFERLKEQFLEFIITILEDEAERKRQQLRRKKKALTAELQRSVDGMRRDSEAGYPYV